ncbi:MAG: Smr/MutS family protein [Clostridia bacterium]|nr:Smr/MutS family protein [Clostridia bacterium]
MDRIIYKYKMGSTACTHNTRQTGHLIGRTYQCYRKNCQHLRRHLDGLRRHIPIDLQHQSAAKRKAAEIVDQARRDTDRLLDEIDALRKEKERADFRERVGAVQKSTAETLDRMEAEVAPKKEKKPLPRPLRIGDSVRIVSLGKVGEVLALPDNKKQVSVQVGIIKTKISLDDLELVEQKKQAAEKPKGKSVYSLGRDTRDASNEIDLRGMNILEAEPVVEGFLDNCRMAGLTTVSIIHGKGTGALRQGVHAMLRRDRNVESFRLGVYGEGETGVTIVTLKQG